MYYAPDGCVAELEYAYASEAYGAILGGSNPLTPTISQKKSLYDISYRDFFLSRSEFLKRGVLWKRLLLAHAMEGAKAVHEIGCINSYNFPVREN